MKTANLNDYSASKELFKKNEKTFGYELWETELETFKLECWFMVNTAKSTIPDEPVIEPVIVQIFPDGNGYFLYKQV